jgi:orotidine-5'-phosphate decarboxylase
MGFLDKLASAQAKNNSLLCVGLDPNMDAIPKHLRQNDRPFFDFLKEIIDATAGLVCAYKPNSAFYEALGADGIAGLKQVCSYLNQNYPDIPIILDYKRGDIGNTNNYYTSFAFDYLEADAITIQPYLGREAAQPYLEKKDKGIIILCRTSNEGADEFQDLEVNGKKLYMQVAVNVATQWNNNGNCLLVVGATYPDEMAEIRRLVGDNMTFLVPGIGAQGGDMEATIKAGCNSCGSGLIISSARAILYASDSEDFAGAAKAAAAKTRDEINIYRSRL